MGREIRRVPPNWEHPRYTAETANYSNRIGEFIPMHDKTFKEAAQEWKAKFAKWEAGERPDYISDEYRNEEFWEYHGGPPDKESYRPEFTEEPTWFQVYETVSEGTPCSPPFATEEELIQYLMTEGGLYRDRYPDLFPLLTREQAERFVKAAWAPSLIVSNGVASLGIEAA